MNKKKIMLAHGSGGQLMQELIDDLIISNFGNQILNRLDDSAVFQIKNKHKKIAFTTCCSVLEISGLRSQLLLSFTIRTV